MSDRAAIEALPAQLGIDAETILHPPEMMSLVA
jgi:hypothetical protein